MAKLDDLRADQRATLQLVLQQGRTYDEIAELLRIEPRAVRERARSGLDALGPDEPGELDLDEQDEVADYLLGQQSASQRARTRELLESSAPARAWARIVSGELRPLAGDDLPEIPADAQETREAFGAVRARDEHRERVQRSSRTGGFLLLGALALLLVGVILFATGAFDGDDGDDPAPAANTAATTGTQTQAGGIVGQENMRQGPAANGAQGILFIAEQSGQRVLAMSADGIRPPARDDPPRNYAIYFTGRGVEPVRAGYPDPQPTQDSPRIQQVIPLPEQLEPRPENPERYDSVLLTREDDRDRTPDEVVLRASLRQARAAAPTGAGQANPEAQAPEQQPQEP